MTQFTVITDSGETLCRVTLAPTSTVAQLLNQALLLSPVLRASIRSIRNEARDSVFLLDGATDALLQQTLQQAELTSAESTLETLVFSKGGSHASAPPGPSLPAASAATSAGTNNSSDRPPQPSSSDDIAARILELFNGASNANSAAGTSSSLLPQQQPSPLPTLAAVSSSTAAAPPSASGVAGPVPHREEPVFFDPEVLSPEQAEFQRRIYEAIRQRQIDENLANALEYTPEIFASVVMLYVPCTINRVPLVAFVDSGAQKSILNRETAEKCGLMRLLDTRMSGVAVGVGRQRILGQIHMTPVNIAGMHIPFAFSVLEKQDMDVIIGLDQLKRHQMVIDLKRGCLTIGDAHVAFLTESEIPKTKRSNLSTAEGAEGGEAEEDELLPEMPEQQQQSVAPAAPATPIAAPPESAESATLVPTDREASARIERFMLFTGIADREQAKDLLEAVGWDADAAAALYFDAA